MRMVLSMRLFYCIRPYNEIILLDRVVHTIERHRMFTPGDRVAIAVSGGADSVCLLHVLRNLAPRWNLTLSVLHINHNLRGDASRAARDGTPALAEPLAHTADLSLAEETYWQGEMERLAKRHLTRQGPAILVSAAALAALPLAAARRLVRHAIHLASGGPSSSDFRHIADVIELAARPQGTGRAQPPGLEVRRPFDWLRLAPPTPTDPYALQPAVPGVTRVPGTDFAISLELLENSETTQIGRA